MDVTQAVLKDALLCSTAPASASRWLWMEQRGAASASGDPVGADPAGDEAEWLTGTSHNLLGLTGAQLREATGSQAQFQAALESCSAEVESELQRRCQLVAVAAQYDSQDCRGLPAHLHTLRLAADQGTQRQCLAQALRLSQQVAEQLDDANCLLLELLLRHRVEGQTDADGARAELLAARCAAMKEELAASTQQLLGQTYTDASVPALQAISDHVQGAVSELEARVQQANARLEAYAALGPRFFSLAAEHAELQRMIGEIEYEVAEVERFALLAGGGRA